MRWILRQDAGDDFWRRSRSFALLPKKCFDLDSRLNTIVWLEPITIIYKAEKDKWKIDHYVINENK